MKKLFVRLALCAGLLTPFISSAAGYWQQVDASRAPQKLQVMHPKSFLVYTMDEAALKLQLWNLPENPDEAIVLSLPMPDGSSRDFKVWQTPMMPAELAARYPQIKTFTAEAVSDRNVTAKIDFTTFGFHAMIFDGDNTSFVDPYDAYSDGYYIVHYKKDETRAAADLMRCATHGSSELQPNGTPVTLHPQYANRSAQKTVNGYQLRTYRLAVSADHFYCQAAPAATTIAAALSKMTTTINRINGVYEREFSVKMNFVANEDMIIWTAATGTSNGTDPFNAIDADASSCLSVNQTQCDTRIGAANYDIGHVFTTGAGGLSLLGVVCTDGLKAQSATGSSAPVGDGYDIDYVAHEMGHEFAAEHPFNNGTDGSCGGGNRNAATAYEPGSGSTIMAYAGICPVDDIQQHSDPYFHAISLSQIQTYITKSVDALGGDCAVKTATGNKLVSYSAFAGTYSIPYLTPFELTAPVLADSVADSATLYCWEEWDLGGSTGTDFVSTTTTGPLFRSFDPATSRIRICPKASMVLAGTLSNAGMENNQGEKVPEVARSLKFRCTFRDIIHNLGAFTFPDDVVTLNAVATSTGAGFAVTSQNTTGVISYAGGSTTTVTWDVVGTNAAPVNATTVNIYLSLNAGNNYLVGNFPNTGSATVTIPNPAATSSAFRFKVKGNNNVFFNVSKKNFTVTTNTSIPVAPNGVEAVAAEANEIKMFPVPATNVLHIASVKEVDAMIVNAVGQKVWAGKIKGQSDIDVAAWAKGIYYVRFAATAGGSASVKSVIIE